MPSHYGSGMKKKNSPKNNKGVHKMPDGTVMTGKVHTSSSRVIKKGSAKPKAKQSKAEAESGIPFEELKEGSLKRMLKMKKDSKPLMKSELNRMSKVEDGEEFEFRGNKLKMSKLMKRRVNLAKNMAGFKK